MITNDSVFFVIFSIIFLSAVVPARAATDLQVSDTNFIFSGKSAIDGKSYTYDYNRLRVRGDYTGEKLKLKLILDNENILGGSYIESRDYIDAANADYNLLFDPRLDLIEKGDLQNRLYLYRLSAELSFDDTVASIGLMRVPFSIGRVWNPTDVFNPVNPLAVEKQERLGVVAGQVVHYFGEFGRLQMTASLREGGDPDKFGLRAKTLVHGVDAGLSCIAGRDLVMVGGELEGNPGETGIELRAEGGWFRIDATDREYFRGLAGLEYGFVQGYTVTVEYLYNGAGFTHKADYGGFVADVTGSGSLGRDYLALLVAKDITPLMSGGLSLIGNLNDQSLFFAPTLKYSVSDNADAGLGYQFFRGDAETEFGRLHGLFYASLNWYF